MYKKNDITCNLLAIDLNNAIKILFSDEYRDEDSNPNNMCMVFAQLLMQDKKVIDTKTLNITFLALPERAREALTKIVLERTTKGDAIGAVTEDSFDDLSVFQHVPAVLKFFLTKPLQMILPKEEMKQ